MDGNDFLKISQPFWPHQKWRSLLSISSHFTSNTSLSTNINQNCCFGQYWVNFCKNGSISKTNYKSQPFWPHQKWRSLLSISSHFTANTALSKNIYTRFTRSPIRTYSSNQTKNSGEHTGKRFSPSFPVRIKYLFTFSWRFGHILLVACNIVLSVMLRSSCRTNANLNLKNHTLSKDELFVKLILHFSKEMSGC